MNWADIVLHKYSGIRHMAQIINRPITDSLYERWAKCAKGMATDFFLGNNLVELAIEINRNRFNGGLPVLPIPNTGISAASSSIASSNIASSSIAASSAISKIPTPDESFQKS